MSPEPEEQGPPRLPGFSVTLPQFEGPFDLLLSLIARKRLDVTELALAEVTDDFIAHMRSDWDLGRASEFIVVASTLLALKAHRLLPHDENEEEPDLELLEARDLLFARLLQYRAFKRVSVQFAALMDAEARRFARPGGLEEEFRGLLPEVTIPGGAERLARLAVRALSPPDVVTMPLEQLHVVTVNDYLAQRDAGWNAPVYHFLGMSVGVIIADASFLYDPEYVNEEHTDERMQHLKPCTRKQAYQADVTYGTNNEFGFDYLRDNMVNEVDFLRQRELNFAIVDEVDSILIDEARTPLIISAPAGDNPDSYYQFAKIASHLGPDDYVLDEKHRSVSLTDAGIEKVQRMLGIDNLYSADNTRLVYHMDQALRAQVVFQRDRDYVVTNSGEVIIVDENTGRLMQGRRYSEGLHQAIEAKESVVVKEESMTLATISFQNFFRLYNKLSGMTGTAMTEDAEFREVYHVPVQVIPPNRPVKREDLDDLVYRTIDAKFEAVVRDVEERHQNGQPVLVGTVSIDNSERISRILSKRGIKHNVLNAKFHEREAQIIAQAGREGAVTIATNMAGRGTDILLGGNPDVMAEDILRNQGIEPAEATQEQKEAARKEAKEICATEREAVTAAGGLCVIGTERHESRRIDNQLRGRSGRQGDPGQTQFYLSLEDDLMRRFGGDRMDGVAAMMQRYELPDDMPIKAKIVTKLVEGAQRKVEEVNFAMRKNVLDYDDVMNKQRQVIYAERNKILDGKDLMELIETVTASTTQRICEEFCYGDADEWDLEGLEKWLTELTGKTDLPEFTEDTKFEQLEKDVTAFVQKTFDEKTQKLGEEVMRELAAQVMLRVIDTRWMAYLQEMDYLKTGIGLRGFG